MRYVDIVRNARHKSEETMWQSVESISHFLDQIEDKVPDMVCDFLLHEYEVMNGGHFNEQMAREEVAKMHHYANDGSHIVGEIITKDESDTIVPSEYYDAMEWDAYVGANGIAHDLARLGLGRDSMMDAAREFWFADDDFPADKSKVWWYYSKK